MLRWLLVVSLASGCWKNTVSTSHIEAEPVLRCIDCEEPVAVGMPIRVHASWNGTCSSTGTMSFLQLGKNDDLRWETEDFEQSDECDVKRYKLDITCSAACVVIGSDAPDSVAKVIGIYPKHPGPFRFDIKMRARGTAKNDSPAKHIAGEAIVRTPDLVGTTKSERFMDVPSERAAFAGYEYDLVPARRDSAVPLVRGAKYTLASAAKDVEIDQFDRLCWARTPGAATWRPCEQGILADDDIRFDVTALRNGVPIEGDVALSDTLGEQTTDWTCYRSKLAAPEICVRYSVPAGTHAFTWKAGDMKKEESFVVGDPSNATAPPDPTSIAVTTATDATDITLDSRALFDSRGARGTAYFTGEGEVIRLRGQTYFNPLLVVKVPVSPRWGGPRVGIGGLTGRDDEPTSFRLIAGWDLEVGCLARHLCLSLAADVGYSFVDPIEGVLALPHVIVDVRGRDLFARLGAGPSYVLGTFLDPGQRRNEVGWVIKLSVGFIRYL